MRGHGCCASSSLSGVGRVRALFALYNSYRATLTGFRPADRKRPGAQAAPPKAAVIGSLGHQPQSSSRRPSVFRSERRRSILSAGPWPVAGRERSRHMPVSLHLLSLAPAPPWRCFPVAHTCWGATPVSCWGECWVAALPGPLDRSVVALPRPTKDVGLWL